MVQRKQRPPPAGGRGLRKNVVCDYLYNWVYAKVSTFTFLAMFSHPYFIKLIHGLLNDFRFISQDASFKVASSFSLHAYTGTRKVRTTDINFFPIENKHLEMNTRTKHSLQAVIEHWVLIKVLPKVRPRFFCMYKPYLHTTPNELGNKCQKWLLLFANLNI